MGFCALDGGEESESNGIGFVGKFRLFVVQTAIFFGVISSDIVLYMRSRSVLAYFALCPFICLLSPIKQSGVLVEAHLLASLELSNKLLFFCLVNLDSV